MDYTVSAICTIYSPSTHYIDMYMTHTFYIFTIFCTCIKHSTKMVSVLEDKDTMWTIYTTCTRGIHVLSRIVASVLRLVCQNLGTAEVRPSKATYARRADRGRSRHINITGAAPPAAADAAAAAPAPAAAAAGCSYYSSEGPKLLLLQLLLMLLLLTQPERQPIPWLRMAATLYKFGVHYVLSDLLPRNTPAAAMPGARRGTMPRSPDAGPSIARPAYPDRAGGSSERSADASDASRSSERSSDASDGSSSVERPGARTGHGGPKQRELVEYTRRSASLSAPSRRWWREALATASWWPDSRQPRSRLCKIQQTRQTHSGGLFEASRPRPHQREHLAQRLSTALQGERRRRWGRTNSAKDVRFEHKMLYILYKYILNIY